MPKESKPDLGSEFLVGEDDAPVPNEPDQHTKKAPVYFEGGAPNQIFRFDRWGLKYGTDDKGHAAAMILSVLLLALLTFGFVGGLLVERLWVPNVLELIGTAFTFVAGVAI